MAKRSFYVKDSELDDYQVKVINKKTDNSYIVKGCAGSGKSILALWKAKQIQDEHKGTYLYIVFTKALMQYMADGISQVGIPQRNVDYHWHWQNRAGCPSADYIIVDEAQDFSKEDIELFRSKAKKALLLYGDSAQQLYTSLIPQPIGFSGILLAKRQNSFYCTYFLHNRNVADTKSPYPIKRLEVIRWFNQKSMVFNQSLS